MALRAGGGSFLSSCERPRRAASNCCLVGGLLFGMTSLLVARGGTGQDGSKSLEKIEMCRHVAIVECDRSIGRDLQPLDAKGASGLGPHGLPWFPASAGQIEPLDPRGQGGQTRHQQLALGAPTHRDL